MSARKTLKHAARFICRTRRPRALSSITCALLGISGCTNRPPPPPPPPDVTVARPQMREVIEWDEYTGYLQAVESVEVRARVSGLIMSAPFQEGAIVKQGELLFEIDVRPFQAELDSRLADQARAEAQLELAQIEYKRVSELPADAATRFELQTAEAKLHEAQAAVAAAKAAVDAARLNVEWCSVTSPIDGRISRKEVNVGNLITGGTGQGTLLTNIVSIDPIYCYVDADEASVLKYQRLAQEGKRVSARQAPIPCFMRRANESGFPHEGVVDFVDNRVDPATGTMRARGVFRNADGWLAPGFFALLVVPGSGRYQAMLVPDGAVVTDQSQKMLLVVDSENTVQARPVRLGALRGKLRVIEEGIGLDDRVIIEGLMRAQRGAKVNSHETTIAEDLFSLVSPGSPTTQELPADPRMPPSAASQATSHPIGPGIPPPTTIPARPESAP